MQQYLQMLLFHNIVRLDEITHIETLHTLHPQVIQRLCTQMAE